MTQGGGKVVVVVLETGRLVDDVEELVVVTRQGGQTRFTVCPDATLRQTSASVAVVLCEALTSQTHTSQAI
jgi:hypothetical protein